MAATSTKGTYKWYILHRNHIISVYLLLIYLSISIVALYELKPVFYLIPAFFVISLTRLAWDQSFNVFSALFIFIVGFMLASYCIASFQTRQQRSLQLMYNYEQFKNITQRNPKIERNSSFTYNMFFVETNPNRGN